MQKILAIIACAACVLNAPDGARAEEPPATQAVLEGGEDGAFHIGDGLAPQIVVTLGAGLPVRLRRDRRLGQGRLAPVYGEVFAGYLFPGSGLQHGLGVTATLGLNEDGGFVEPVDALSQALLGPTYALAIDLDPALLTMARVTVPVSFVGDLSVGLDLGATAGYRVFAGAGVYAEASLSAFVGLAGRIYPMAALEIGLMIDYEVLP